MRYKSSIVVDIEIESERERERENEGSVAQGNFLRCFLNHHLFHYLMVHQNPRKRKRRLFFKFSRHIFAALENEIVFYHVLSVVAII
jgi:hypothetical protein